METNCVTREEFIEIIENEKLNELQERVEAFLGSKNYKFYRKTHINRESNYIIVFIYPSDFAFMWSGMYPYEDDKWNLLQELVENGFCVTGWNNCYDNCDIGLSIKIDLFYDDFIVDLSEYRKKAKILEKFASENWSGEYTAVEMYNENYFRICLGRIDSATVTPACFEELKTFCNKLIKNNFRVLSFGELQFNQGCFCTVDAFSGGLVPFDSLKYLENYNLNKNGDENGTMFFRIIVSRASIYQYWLATWEIFSANCSGTRSPSFNGLPGSLSK